MTVIQFAQKAVVTDNDQILMVRKSKKDPNNPGLWELPGGRLKESEDVDAHIIREVLEETGFTVQPGRLIHLWSWDMPWHGEQVRVIAVSRYCTLCPTAAIEPSREADDYLADQRWFDRSDLLSLDIIPSQRTTIQMVIQSAH